MNPSLIDTLEGITNLYDIFELLQDIGNVIRQDQEPFKAEALRPQLQACRLLVHVSLDGVQGSPPTGGETHLGRDAVLWLIQQRIDSITGYFAASNGKPVNANDLHRELRFVAIACDTLLNSPTFAPLEEQR